MQESNILNKQVPGIVSIHEFNAVNPYLKDLGEDVMGFLNEIQLKYPRAISLASGRPDEQFFGIDNFPAYFDTYVDSVVSPGKDRTAVLNSLGQYNRTKGIINDLVSRYLEKDEAIKATPEDILITVGAQEGMAITVATLCDRAKDVILVEDPVYVGITHLSIILGYAIEPVPVDLNGMSTELLEKQINLVKASGRHVKIVYVTPDFQNPTGNSMPLENRRRLLELAEQYDFYIIEDNAYGDFVYQGPACPALKALDTNKRVIYLRSFSKTLYPSLRLAAMVTGQLLIIDGKTVPLSDLMAKTKGYISVNTPSINQAVLGGMLIRNDYSLKEANKEKITHMMQKRNRILEALDKYLGTADAPWAKDISWNHPQGGFFVTVKVPFAVSKEDVIYCAEKHRIIFTPMSFFFLRKGGENEIRLAFSYLPETEITPAIGRLADWLKNKLLHIDQ